MTLAEFYDVVHEFRDAALRRVDAQYRADAEDVYSNTMLELVREYRNKGEQSRIAKATPLTIHTYMIRAVSRKAPGYAQAIKGTRMTSAETADGYDRLSAAPDTRPTPLETLLEAEAGSPAQLPETLTARQRECMTLLQEGLSMQAIATKLGLVKSTVHQNIALARQKMA